MPFLSLYFVIVHMGMSEFSLCTINIYLKYLYIYIGTKLQLCDERKYRMYYYYIYYISASEVNTSIAINRFWFSFLLVIYYAHNTQND